jgi:hypothetical protein
MLLFQTNFVLEHLDVLTVFMAWHGFHGMPTGVSRCNQENDRWSGQSRHDPLCRCAYIYFPEAWIKSRICLIDGFRKKRKADIGCNFLKYFLTWEFPVLFFSTIYIAHFIGTYLKLKSLPCCTLVIPGASQTDMLTS